MTSAEARKIFDDAISKTTDPEAIARIEVVREYACNPQFRDALRDYLWNLSQNQ